MATYVYFNNFFPVTHKSCNIHVYSSSSFVNWMQQAKFARVFQSLSLSLACLAAELIANCRNVRGLGLVSYIDYIENLNISTEMLVNEKLPAKFKSFPQKSFQMGASQSLQNSIQILIILWLVYAIHTNSLF